jgi:hypothetical protein
VFPDWQVWCCLSMMVTCCWLLLPRPQTRQLDFVVHPYAYTYVHLFFPLRFSLVNSCVYIVPTKTPCPAIGHHVMAEHDGRRPCCKSQLVKSGTFLGNRRLWTRGF